MEKLLLLLPVWFLPIFYYPHYDDNDNNDCNNCGDIIFQLLNQSLKDDNLQRERTLLPHRFFDNNKQQ